MSEQRIEKNSLGPVSVPAEALYGAQTQRAVENFRISGLRPWRAFIWSMATIKQAAAKVNLDLGLFADREAGGRHFTGRQLADAIIQAADEVLAGRWDDQFVVDPFQAGARHQPQYERQRGDRQPRQPDPGLRAGRPKKPVSPNDHVNMAQCTNDTIPTAIRLGALWRLDELLGAIDGLARRAGGQGARVRRCGQVGPHPPAGCRAGAAGPGVRRLCAGRAQRPRADRSRRPTGCGDWGSAARPPAPA